MKIKTTHVVTVPAGTVLNLTDIQLNARLSSVKPLSGQPVQATAQMDFKSGTELEFIGDVPKSIPAEWYVVVDDETLLSDAEQAESNDEKDPIKSRKDSK